MTQIMDTDFWPGDAAQLSAAQTAEIERRLVTVEEDIRHGIDADALERELDRRYA